MSDAPATRDLVPRVLTAFGRVDAVVNSASTFEYDRADSFTYAMLEKHLLANTAPAIVMAQALAVHVGEHDGEGGAVNLLDQKRWNPNPDVLR